MIPCRSKKNALIMFLLTWPVARLTKYCVSMSSALSMSTWEPSTAAAMIASGPGIGAPLICLRRFAGKAGSIAANLGFDGVPPGILYPLTSQGCEASGLALIHAFAAGINSAGR
jgi:hypothetical protein